MLNKRSKHFAVWVGFAIGIGFSIVVMFAFFRLSSVGCLQLKDYTTQSFYSE